MKLDFMNDLDAVISECGVAVLFVLNHDGLLQLDLMRSRDFRRYNPGPWSSSLTHTMLVDHGTGWPQYALFTSCGLAQFHPRLDIHLFDAEYSALAAVEEEKKMVYERSK